jgi:hypothetical protein
MPTLIAGVVAVVVLYSLLQMFRAANPAVLARALKIVGGVVTLAMAAFTGARGDLERRALGVSADCSLAAASNAHRDRHPGSARNSSK